MDDMAPVVPLFPLNLMLKRDGRLCLLGERQILGWNRNRDGRAGMQGEETCFGSHDLEVSGPFVACVIGSGLFGDENRSGEPVDIEVPLRLPVGVHGDEGIGGILSSGIADVVHDHEFRFGK